MMSTQQTQEFGQTENDSLELRIEDEDEDDAISDNKKNNLKFCGKKKNLRVGGSAVTDPHAAKELNPHPPGHRILVSFGTLSMPVVKVLGAKDIGEESPRICVGSFPCPWRSCRRSQARRFRPRAADGWRARRVYLRR